MHHDGPPKRCPIRDPFSVAEFGRRVLHPRPQKTRPFGIDESTPVTAPVGPDVRVEGNYVGPAQRCLNHGTALAQGSKGIDEFVDSCFLRGSFGGGRRAPAVDRATSMKRTARILLGPSHRRSYLSSPMPWEPRDTDDNGSRSAKAIVNVQLRVRFLAQKAVGTRRLGDDAEGVMALGRNRTHHDALRAMPRPIPKASRWRLSP